MITLLIKINTDTAIIKVLICSLKIQIQPKPGLCSHFPHFPLLVFSYVFSLSLSLRLTSAPWVNPARGNCQTIQQKIPSIYPKFDAGPNWQGHLGCWFDSRRPLLVEDCQHYGHICASLMMRCVSFMTLAILKLWQIFKKAKIWFGRFFWSFYYMNDPQWCTVCHCVSFMMHYASLMTHSASLCDHSVGSPLYRGHLQSSAAGGRTVWHSQSSVPSRIQAPHISEINKIYPEYRD